MPEAATAVFNQQEGERISRKSTLRRLLSVMGRHRFAFSVVGVLVILSGLASLGGTYMIRPLVNAAAAGKSREV